MDTNSIAKIASALRKTFPTLDESQIATLTLQERANVLAQVTIPAAPHSPSAVIPSVEEIVERMREKYMRKETRRIRAKIQPDGSINIKDTTTYRTYNTHWKRLVKAHGMLPITDLDQEMISNFAEAAQDSALATHKAANATRIAKGLTPREFTGGRSHNLALDAVSVIMSYAVSKKYIPDNPVKGVQRAKKTAGKRRGLAYAQVKEIMHVALNGGNDPILDYILLWCLLGDRGENRRADKTANWRHQNRGRALRSRLALKTRLRPLPAHYQVFARCPY
jgi:hypothetical protein